MFTNPGHELEDHPSLVTWMFPLDSGANMFHHLWLLVAAPSASWLKLLGLFLITLLQ